MRPRSAGFMRAAALLAPVAAGAASDGSPSNLTLTFCRFVPL
jgi:hypothetical protein